ncbi:hypothetical protein D9M73_289760 [compost metagenome]
MSMKILAGSEHSAVTEEATTAFAAEVTGIDKLAQQRSGAILGVVEAFMKHLHDR